MEEMMRSHKSRSPCEPKSHSLSAASQSVLSDKTKLANARAKHAPPGGLMADDDQDKDDEEEEENERPSLWARVQQKLEMQEGLLPPGGLRLQHNMK